MLRELWRLCICGKAVTVEEVPHGGSFNAIAPFPPSILRVFESKQNARLASMRVAISVVEFQVLIHTGRIDHEEDNFSLAWNAGAAQRNHVRRIREFRKRTRAPGQEQLTRIK